MSSQQTQRAPCVAKCSFLPCMTWWIKKEFQIRMLKRLLLGCWVKQGNKKTTDHSYRLEMYQQWEKMIPKASVILVQIWLLQIIWTAKIPGNLKMVEECPLLSQKLWVPSVQVHWAWLQRSWAIRLTLSISSLICNFKIIWKEIKRSRSILTQRIRALASLHHRSSIIQHSRMKT